MGGKIVGGWQRRSRLDGQVDRVMGEGWLGDCHCGQACVLWRWTRGSNYSFASNPAEPQPSCMENGKWEVACGLSNTFKASRTAHTHSTGLLCVRSYADTQKDDSGSSFGL